MKPPTKTQQTVIADLTRRLRVHADAPVSREDADRLIRALLYIDGERGNRGRAPGVDLTADLTLVAQLEATRRPAKPERKEQVNQFATLMRPKARNRLIADHVFDELARRFGVDESELRGRRRPEPVVTVRHWCWWILVRKAGMSQMGVGRIVGRDASTVWHAVQKIDREVRRGRVPVEVADLVVLEEVA